MNLPDLLRKYDVQGPRYTSYPTVPYWDNSPTEEQWLGFLKQELDQAIDRKSGAALYLHIPFCEALCTFCACNKIITKKHERAVRYIDNLHGEWSLYKKHLQPRRIPVSEIHLGGGTPTFLTPSELEMLLQPILADIDLLPEAELSFEADPRVTTEEHLAALAKLGFRRISLGVQDYDPTVQKAINRVQSAEMITGVIAKARQHGFTGVNFDLVYGLPHQTQNTIRTTIQQVIAQRPDRIAFYAYAHVPWVGQTGQRGFDENDLPGGDEKRSLYDLGRSLLQEAGYVEIGMDHFALPHDALLKAADKGTLFRNFMGYVPHHVSPLLGLGVSSISDAWRCFAQNEKNLPSYEAKIAAGQLPLHRGHILTDEDLVLRQVILDLMTKFKTDWSDLPLINHGAVRELLAEAVNDNLIRITPETVTVLEQGKPFIRNICMGFDARLQRNKPDARIFSRTI